MNKRIILTLLLSLSGTPLQAAVDQHTGHSDNENRIAVSMQRARRAGIVVATAGPAPITEAVLLYGRTEPDPQRVSHVRARFPGLIRSVGPALGSAVTAGQQLASIESNDSLQRYTIKAPISGIVVERHANAGEYAGDEPLLTIADYSRLWVSLSVFPQDAERLRAGQSVRLKAGQRRAVSSVSFLNPGTGNRPSIMARLPLDNRAGDWTPGLLVEGEVIVDQFEAAVAIDNRALQEVEGQPVVFVQIADGFELTPVTLGRRDKTYSEVLSGLAAGCIYAVQNSYLLKAEREKSGAAHVH